MSTTVGYGKLDRIHFSGKSEDFPVFAEQFEARMSLLDLDDVLLGKEKAPVTPDIESSTQTTARLVVVAAFQKKNKRVWCELIQFLDKKSVMLVRLHKNEGQEAWASLMSHFKGTERPRIQHLLSQLTSLRMGATETMPDYLLRAEELQIELAQVGESLSQNMLCSMVLQGLSSEYDSVRTVVSLGNTELKFLNIKPMLINNFHERERAAVINRDAPAALMSNEKKCFNCGKMGHYQSQCRAIKKVGGGGSKPSGKCFNCGKAGHFARDCRSGRKTPVPAKNPHSTSNSGLVSTSSTVNDDPFCFMSTGNSNELPSYDLVIDSGCTGYMVKDEELFVNLDRSRRGSAGAANSSRDQIEGVGDVQIWARDDAGESQRITLKDSYFVPTYIHNLVSVSKLREVGVSIDFNKKPHLKAPNGTIFPFNIVNGLYVLEAKPTCGDKSLLSSAASLTTWHQRLGHNNRRDVQSLQRSVEGMKIGSTDFAVCEPCETQKARRAPITRTWGTRATRPLEIVHSDILGPMDESLEGHRFAVGFVDSFSRHTWVYMMKRKDETLEKMKRFIADVGAPGILVTDCGGEYLSGAMQQLCRDKSIAQQTTSLYTPEDNGKAERVWGTVMGMARSMLREANCPKAYWSHALRTAFYIKNRCLHAALGKTPFEVFHGARPDVSGLRVFGCIAYSLVERFKKKLDAKAQVAVFLGYETTSNSYTLGVPDGRGGVHITRTRNVTFDENGFYFKTPQPTGPDLVEPESVLPDVVNGEPPTPELQPIRPQPATPRASLAPRQPGHSPGEPIGPDQNELELPSPDDSDAETLPYERQSFSPGPMNDTTLPYEAEPPAAPVRRGRRAVGPRDLPTVEEQEEPAIAARPQRNRRPPPGFEDFVNHEQAVIHELALSSEEPSLPGSTEDALVDPNWKPAMVEEYESLVKNGTWELKPLQPGHKAVGSKWDFKLKLGPDGKVTRYKARFCAKGYTQVYGRDFEETFAPTAKFTTIRLLLAVAAQLKCTIYQMDIKTAYLNADLEETVFVQQPQGFEQEGPGGEPLYCLLRKSLYGLKQSGRNWYKLLRSHLLELGFKSCDHDQCLFIKDQRYFLAVYVDDIIYFSPDSGFRQEFNSAMGARFKVGADSELHWFLGMRVYCHAGRITVNHEKYIDAVLLRFGMDQCKSTSTPLAEKVQLLKDDCPAEGSPEAKQMRGLDYRGLVGSLNYLAVTSRPDIAYACHSLSCYLNNPGPTHWTAAKHVMRYLRGTKTKGLEYRHDPAGLVLKGYADADWAGDLNNRRSTSGYCFQVQGSAGAVSWGSKMQSTVATSTAEAEVNAAVLASQEVVHLLRVLKDMGYPQAPPTLIYVDNQAAIAISANPVKQARTKHFDIRVHYLRELVVDGLIKLTYIPTAENLADALTKGLGRIKTNYFCTNILGIQGEG